MYKAMQSLERGDVAGAIGASTSFDWKESNQKVKSVIDGKELRNDPIEKYMALLLRKTLAEVQTVHRQNIDVKRIKVTDTNRVQAVSSINQGEREVHITRGMLYMMQNEAELVALIGHEIGHHALGHTGGNNSAKKLEQGLGTQLTKELIDTLFIGQTRGALNKQVDEISATSFSRDNEEDADIFGAELAASMGYDPYAFVDFIRRLDSKVEDSMVTGFLQDIKGSHETLDDRAEHIEEYLQSKGYVRGEGQIGLQAFFQGMDAYSHQNLQNVSEDMRNDIATIENIKVRFKSKEPLHLNDFMDKMDTLSKLAQKYGITAADYLQYHNIQHGKHFMQEEIFANLPVWAQDSILIYSEFLGVLWDLHPFYREGGGLDLIIGLKDWYEGKPIDPKKQFSYSMTPGLNDAMDLYQFYYGKDIFTGEELGLFWRVASGVSLIAGSAAAGKKIIDKLGNITSEGRAILRSTGKTDKFIDFLRKNGGERVAQFAERVFKRGVVIFRGAATGADFDKALSIRSYLAKSDLPNNLRKKFSSGRGNIGFADFDIAGNQGSLSAFSGTADLPGFAPFVEPAKRILTSIEAGGFNRAVDSEAKILEQILKNTNSADAGKIRLFTELPVCNSCELVINQFSKLRPNIVIEIIEGIQKR